MALSLPMSYAIAHAAKINVKTAARLIQGFIALRVGMMPDWVRLRLAESSQAAA